jgi:cellobiose phosphorylase
MGEAERARRYEKLFPQMTGAAQAAWDGEWYLRAYDDEGRAVGSRRNGECAIDSVSQSFAVFAPSGEAKQNRQALRAAYEKLYDREHQLVRLLWPPFHGDSDPGYIRAYPDGLRENGGQYTHAACWLAMALLRSGETDKAWELLHDLLPEHHPWQQYRAEPYVLAGDVYDAQGQQGRGGWSWYTGAAGWYCQTVTRYLLGLRLERGALTITPNLPEHWQGYEADWKGAQYDLHIQVLRGDAAGTTLDGALWQGKIPLSTLRGHHEVKVMIPYVKK